LRTAIESLFTRLTAQTAISTVKNIRRQFVEETYPAMLSQIQTTTIPLLAIYPANRQVFLASEIKVIAYLAQLKQAIMKEIKKGKMISL
jgi:hypothetical protein